MRERPLLLGALTALPALALVGALSLFALRSPEAVVIGAEGRHDGLDSGPRLAACLDCHVPFVGTPRSRCLAPGCHGELATGTPPTEGKAMPIRFHVALREEPCTSCHMEHASPSPPKAFSHAVVPPAILEECRKCHFAAGLPNHARADSIECGLCHGTDRFALESFSHARVTDEPCDLCHRPPNDERHSTIAGTCDDCHETSKFSKVKNAP